MKLKEKKRLQQAFTFSAADIDTAADFVMDSLTELGLPAKMRCVPGCRWKRCC